MTMLQEAVGHTAVKSIPSVRNNLIKQKAGIVDTCFFRNCKKVRALLF